jgi:hypothetical protein
MHKGKLGGKGEHIGNMSPTVEDMQRPESVYNQKFLNQTTEYIPRHNKLESQASSKVKNQGYKGRYS